MTDQPDETIVVRYVVEGQEAIARAKEINAQFTQIKEQLKSMAATSGQSFKQLADGMIAAAKVDMQHSIMGIRQLGKEAGLTKEQIQDLVNKQTAGFAQFSTNTRRAESDLSKLGNTAKSSFSSIAIGIGAAFGMSAISIVRSFFSTITEQIKEGIESAYEFAKGMFQISVGVNALRRAGTDITFAEVTEQLKKLKTEFGVFSMKDLVQGSAAFLNLNRDMGFTKEELFDLQEAIATLAVVNGRAMDEVQKTVALALSSGYTEGLQRLGVSINRVTIAEKAAALGYADSYMALNELERSEATRILILEKTAIFEKDLLEYQKSMPGLIDKTTKATEDQTVALGQNLLGWKLWAAQTKNLFVDLLTLLSGAFNFSAREEFELGLIKQREESLGRILTAEERIAILHAADMAWSAGMVQGSLSIQQLFEKYQIPSEKYNPERIGEPPVETIEPPALTDDQVEAVEAVGEKILDLQRQYDINRRDLAIDLQRDLAEIEQDGADKIAEIMADHAQKMLDIANKASDQIRDAQLRYDLDVQQAWDEYYGNLASASESHANKLLKIEEDYQEKLKRLKEGFLLDLEDALHERDARQVLRLIRQYNLDRTQATRERDQNLRDEARAYEEQLHELDRQRRERLKKLKQELDLRLQMIATQRDRELALEVEKFNHEMAQQREENKKKREERLLKNQQDLDDLKLHLEDRLKLIAKDLADLGITTAAGMQAVTDIMNTYVGPGGVSDGIMNYFMAQIRAVIATMSGLSALSAAIPSETRFTNPNQPGFASGGMAYASKPTTAVFGEAGPEVALFLPLSKLLSGATNNRSELPAITKTGNGDKGKLRVEVLLEAGLVGRIVDKAHDEVADVVFGRLR